MQRIESFFATQIYQDRLSDQFNHDELLASCQSVAADDDAGHNWCDENDFAGYTSYASLTDLPWRFPIFADLVAELDQHVARFAEALAFDLDGRALALEDIWINVLPQGGTHSAHIHPHSVISGTTYVHVPTGSSAIKFEDPRHMMMMAAPPRRSDAPPSLRNFITLQPNQGDIYLWESWLRHEVPMNMGEQDRISVSFNYRWGD